MADYRIPNWSLLHLYHSHSTSRTGSAFARRGLCCSGYFHNNSDFHHVVLDLTWPSYWHDCCLPISSNCWGYYLRPLHTQGSDYRSLCQLLHQSYWESCHQFSAVCPSSKEVAVVCRYRTGFDCSSCCLLLLLVRCYSPSSLRNWAAASCSSCSGYYYCTCELPLLLSIWD